jgi:hypothetical protein
MMTRQPERLFTWVILILLLALPAGAINIHAHTDGKGKTCTLCQAPHLQGSFAAVPGVSHVLACADRVAPGADLLVADTSAAAVRSRAPPTRSPIS